jgi:flavin-dependent dehydrogenase
MTGHYDIIIVGAGPAGLMAARTAGEEGLKVAVLDRKKDITKIHRSCAGAINLNVPIFGVTVQFDEHRKQFAFTDLGTAVTYPGPYQNIYAFHLYSPGGKRLEFGHIADLRKDPPTNRLGIAVNKEILLQSLLEEVMQHDVTVFSNSNVSSLREESGEVIVTCKEHIDSLRGTFCITADGINSRIARLLGMNRNRLFFGTISDASLVIKRTACPDPDGFLFMITPRGVLSMMPYAAKDCYHLSASTLMRAVEPLELLNYFLNEDATFSKWFKNSEVLEHRTACVVNLMSPMEIPCKGHVLFIGDACWRREISNVGALSTGWKAGKCIAEAIKKEKPGQDAFQEYIDWYQANYYNPHGKRPQGGREFTKYLNPEDIDYLAGLPSGDFPQTIDFLKVVDCIGRTYAELFPRIYEERPDIMDKLIKIRENAEEDMKKNIRQGFRNV